MNYMVELTCQRRRRPILWIGIALWLIGIKIPGLLFRVKVSRVTG